MNEVWEYILVLVDELWEYILVLVDELVWYCFRMKFSYSATYMPYSLLQEQWNWGGKALWYLELRIYVHFITSYTCLQITVFDSKSQITLLCNVIPQDLVQVRDTVWHFQKAVWQSTHKGVALSPFTAVGSPSFRCLSSLLQADFNTDICRQCMDSLLNLHTVVPLYPRVIRSKTYRGYLELE